MKRLRVAWLATMLSACSGSGLDVGEGTYPEELFLGIGARLASLDMDECTSTQLYAYFRFDGESESVSDFTARAGFRSSDPATVFVGDGISRSPDGTVYAPGALIAIKPGLATISASYLDFNATIAVQVQALNALRIEPALTDIAEDLPQKFDLVAAFHQERPEEDVSEIAAWSFETATGRAAVDAGGAVQANRARDDDPALTLIARLPECGRSASTTFRVSKIDALELEYEFGDDARLPLGTTEGVRVQARFANPDAVRQNISRSAELENVPDDFLTVGIQQSATPTSLEDIVNPVTIRNDLLLVGTTGEAGTGAFDIRVRSGGGHLVRTRTWSVLDIGLDSVRVAPDVISVRYPASGKLTAIGRFDNGMERDISRHVAWTSPFPQAAEVSAAPDDAGRVNVANVDLDLLIEARNDTAQRIPADDAVVRIYSSANPPPTEDPS